MGILKNAKGKGHLSDEGSEDSDIEMDQDDENLDREFVKPAPNPINSITAPVVLTRVAPAAFNASGSLGVVFEPAASTSTHDFDKTSARPPTAPADMIVAVGSGLMAGATVTVVRSRLGKKGVRSEMGQRMMNKGKGREVDSESEGSEFDSSDDGNDESEKDDDDAEGASDADSWRGIEEIPDETIETVEEGSIQPESSDEGQADAIAKREKGAFQAWAEEQVAVAGGHEVAPAPATSSWNDVYVPLLPAGSGAGFQKGPDPSGITGPLGAVLTATQLPSMPPQRSTYIPIERSEEMQKQRKELPIVKEEDRIMEAIRGNAVVVICGETGSGKTTQIGQFLWEAGWETRQVVGFLSLMSYVINADEELQTIRVWSPLLSLDESPHCRRVSVSALSSAYHQAHLSSLTAFGIHQRRLTTPSSFS